MSDDERPAPPRSGSHRTATHSNGCDTTRDVVIVEGTVEALPIGADAELEDAHARSAGFDPRTLRDEYVYLPITPQEIQVARVERARRPGAYAAGRLARRGVNPVGRGGSGGQKSSHSPTTLPSLSLK
jgi:hypothetical protein